MPNKSITLFVMCLVLVAITFMGIGVKGVFLLKQRPNHCAMTYMYPSYHPIHDVARDSRSRGYSLYLYREVITRDPLRLEVSGVPVLFIPGNAGSHAQVRSIASVTSRQQKREFDFFTIDFNEELSGFSGRLLKDQIYYVNQCIQHILSMYKGVSHPPSSVIVLGHSMGGFVGRALLFADNYVNNSVKLVVTLASPHRHAPMYVDSTMYRLYDNVNSQWEALSQRKQDSVCVISIAGGSADTHVRSDLAVFTPSAAFVSLLETQKSSSSSSSSSNVSSDGDNSVLGFSTSTMHIPYVWLSPDHLCVLWCNQLVVQISEFLSAYVARQGRDVVSLTNRFFESSFHAFGVTTGTPQLISKTAVANNKEEVFVPAWAKSVILVSSVKFSVKCGVNASLLHSAVISTRQYVVHHTFPSSSASFASVATTAASSSSSVLTVNIPPRAHFTVQFLNVSLLIDDFSLTASSASASSTHCCKMRLLRYGASKTAVEREEDYCLPSIDSVSSPHSLFLPPASPLPSNAISANIKEGNFLHFLTGTSLIDVFLPSNHPIIWSVVLPSPQLQQYPLLVHVKTLDCPANAGVLNMLHASVPSTNEHVFANLSHTSEAISIQFFSSGPSSNTTITLLSDAGCSFNITVTYDRVGAVVHLLRMSLPLLPSATLSIACGVLAYNVPGKTSMGKLGVCMILGAILFSCVFQVPSLFSHFDWVDRGAELPSIVFLVALFLAALPLYTTVWLVSVMVTMCGCRCVSGSVACGSKSTATVLGGILVFGVFGHFGCAYYLLILLVSTSQESVSSSFVAVLFLANPPAFASMVLSLNLLAHGTSSGLWSPLYDSDIEVIFGFMSTWLLTWCFLRSRIYLSRNMKVLAWLGTLLCFGWPLLPFIANWYIAVFSTYIFVSSLTKKLKDN